MSKATNAADRWHPQLYTIKALIKLAMDVTAKHAERDKCTMDEEIQAACQVLEIAYENLKQVIEELTDENYRLVEKGPVAA